MAGYAVPPRMAVDLARLPEVDSKLVSADGIKITSKDISEVLAALSRGDMDSALLPIMYEVDGISTGKELGGFIKLQFMTPKSVLFAEEGDEEALQRAKKQDVNARVR